jgi:hypothetical protein
LPGCSSGHFTDNRLPRNKIADVAEQCSAVQRNKITMSLPSFGGCGKEQVSSFQNKETAVPQHA